MYSFLIYWYQVVFINAMDSPCEVLWAVCVKDATQIKGIFHSQIIQNFLITVFCDHNMTPPKVTHNTQYELPVEMSSQQLQMTQSKAFILNTIFFLSLFPHFGFFK